jgi:hypothetical protein
VRGSEREAPRQLRYQPGVGEIAGADLGRLKLDRRGFLRGAGLGAGLVFFGQLPALPAAAEGATAGEEARFFSAYESELLTQIVERMVETGAPDAPAVRDTRAIETIDRSLRGLDPALSGALPIALRLFEWGPFLFDFTFSRFTSMSDAGKDASLECWMTSRLALRRQAFMALRNLAFLGYWSQDETWPLIGYKGPLLDGGRRA